MDGHGCMKLTSLLTFIRIHTKIFVCLCQRCAHFSPGLHLTVDYFKVVGTVQGTPNLFYKPLSGRALNWQSTSDSGITHVHVGGSINGGTPLSLDGL